MRAVMYSSKLSSSPVDHRRTVISMRCCSDTVPTLPTVAIRTSSGDGGENGFEIGPFGETNRMVFVVAGFVDDGELVSASGGAVEHRGSESVGANPARTGRLDQDPSGDDKLDRKFGEAGVGPKRARNRSGSGCERRRVDDDEIELFALVGELVHDFERVAGGGIERGVRCVDSKVLGRRGGGVRGEVGGVNRAGSTGCGVDRETSVAAENIKHPGVERHCLNQRPDPPACVTRLLER